MLATHASSDHNSAESGKHTAASESARPGSAVSTEAVFSRQSILPNAHERGNGVRHAAQVAHLQRTVGNRATRRLVHTSDPTSGPPAAAQQAGRSAQAPSPAVQRTIAIGGQPVVLRRGLAVIVG